MSDNKKTLKNIGIISMIIFSVIVILSILWIHHARSDLAIGSGINIIILSAGVIGLTYCILTLRKFDQKIDKEVFNHLIKEYNKNNNGG